jgi:hypothetical protein
MMIYEHWNSGYRSNIVLPYEKNVESITKILVLTTRSSWQFPEKGEAFVRIFSQCLP